MQDTKDISLSAHNGSQNAGTKERSLTDLFHRIKQVLPDEQELITFTPDTPVIEAFEIMRKNNISQVPVTEGVEVLGVFSYRSFANGMTCLPENERKDLSLPVEEFLEKLTFAQITDELKDLLDEFDFKDAVLVGSEDRLQGMITSIDALRYFYRIASPFVMIGEIELAIRELIRASVGAEEQKECIKMSLEKHYSSEKRSLPVSLEEMTFSDYVMLLRYKATWKKFEYAFGKNCNLVYAKLRHLPDLRNNIFHFKKEITIEEYDSLRDARDWLLTRIRKVGASKEMRQNT